MKDHEGDRENQCEQQCDVATRVFYSDKKECQELVNENEYRKRICSQDGIQRENKTLHKEQ